jgi:hypothetical protein
MDAKDKAQPKPSAENQMIYACGVRDGLQLVLDHLHSFKAAIKELKE